MNRNNHFSWFVPQLLSYSKMCSLSSFLPSNLTSCHLHFLSFLFPVLPRKTTEWCIFLLLLRLVFILLISFSSSLSLSTSDTIFQVTRNSWSNIFSSNFLNFFYFIVLLIVPLHYTGSGIFDFTPTSRSWSSKDHEWRIRYRSRFVTWKMNTFLSSSLISHLLTFLSHPLFFLSSSYRNRKGNSSFLPLWSSFLFHLNVIFF